MAGYPLPDPSIGPRLAEIRARLESGHEQSALPEAYLQLLLALVDVLARQNTLIESLYVELESRQDD